MMEPIFITGTGTDVGKTIASIIVINALEADYWKPVQAGVAEGTDSQFVQSMLMNSKSIVHPETYTLKLAASPHIAAREEGRLIDLNRIMQHYYQLSGTNARLVIEGAGGLLVPLNENEHIIDLIFHLKARVILVSRNYLGSINHSLLTASVCRQKGLDVLGWIFNDEFMQYQDDISRWSGYPVIGQIPNMLEITREKLEQQSKLFRNNLIKMLETGVHDEKRITKNI